jgi:hypothetical protein
MSVRTDVINDALIELGQPTTTGPDDDSDPIVVAIVEIYNRTATRILAGYPWNFAMKVAQLAQLSTTLDGWTYTFAKPTACVRIVKVCSQADMRRRPDIDFEDREGQISTQYAETWLAYVDGTFAGNDSGGWPEPVKTAFALELAARVAPKTDMSRNERELLLLRARSSMTEARRWDAQQNKVQKPGLSSWQRARLAGGSGRNG